MFTDPFQPQSVQAAPKEAPKRPKSPPKSSEEWILSQEEHNQIGLGLRYAKKRDQLQGGGDHLTAAAEAWPKRAPEGERLLEESEKKDKANLIFGSLESIKDDIKRHARMWLMHLHVILCFAGQLSRKVREQYLSLSLYKLTTFVTCSITELSTSETLPIYLQFPQDVASN